MTTRPRRLPSGFWKGSTGRSTRRSKTTRAVRSLAPRTRKAITAIATRVVKRKAETKWAAFAAMGPTVLYGATNPIGAPAQVYPAICPVAVGTSDNQRIGNQINPVKCGADLFLSLAQTAMTGGTSQVNSWDITAHIWYGYVKRYKNADAVVANAAAIGNELLDVGGSMGAVQYKAFGGLTQDLMFPTNKDALSLKHKSIRLYKSFGQANTNPPLAGGVTQYFPDRVSALMKLSFKPPKVLKYALQAEPENYCPIVIIGYAHNDATQAADGNVGTPILAAEMTTKIWFKDE